MGIQNKCGVTLGSVTAATHAQRVLASAAIYSEVVKLDNDRGGKGCVYGVEFPCLQKGNVKAILGNAGIRFRNFYTDEGVDRN